MHMDELETFVALVNERSFTKVALKKSISQPTVSVHLKNLEREFSTTLLTRTTKQLHLTPAGELFYQEALVMLHSYKRLKDTLHLRKAEVAGLLNIGASFTIGEYLLPGILATMQQQYPDLEFEITINNTDAIVKAVHQFDVEIGLIEGTSLVENVTQTPFKRDRLLIVTCSNDHSLYSTIDHLQNQAWVIREEGSGTRRSFDHLIQANQLVVASSLVISSTQGIKESVKNGLGLALLSEATIKEELKHGTLKEINIPDVSETRSFSYVINKESPLEKNAHALIKELQKEEA
ncbi:LysR family transcriptional regulator YeiE [Bacillus sp. JCM 19046]|nr:LysR family transcriptional regulator YeiE [Bacillus sp. JCM 19045]GAF18166.1 LysR family transcriptional regulator YeiE [Bacillus sp. JCM 19046]